MQWEFIHAYTPSTQSADSSRALLYLGKRSYMSDSSLRLRIAHAGLAK